MKKLLWVLGLVIMIVPLVFSITPVLAGPDEENLEKAAQVALETREKILVEKKALAESLVLEAAKDGVVTKDEMAAFKKAVEDFTGTKTKFDQKLKVYERATSTVLKEGYEKAKNTYFLHALRVRDEQGAVRKFFASETGKDVVVQSDWDFDVVCVLLILLACIGIFLIWVAIKENSFGLFLFGLFVAIVSVMFLFLL